MSVAIKKVEGVESVKVSLNQGLATVTLKPGNRTTLDQVREIVRRNGFTPKGADVRVAGRLTERGGKAALAVSGLDLVYLLADHPEAKVKVSELQRAAKDQAVLVMGSVPERAANLGPNEPDLLQLREFTLQGD